jgi:adenylate kinase
MQILFLGPPGAGKGTQSKFLSAYLNVPHLSSGELLRDAVKRGTSAGEQAKGYMDKGVLVPDPVLIAMFKEVLHKPDCSKGFVLDGFPRNLAQAQSLDALLSELGLSLNAVINLQVDPEIVIERISGRRVCTNCRTQYHVKFAPPKVPDVCDVCGSPLGYRTDDKPELVAQRLEVYDQETAPLIEYYDKRSLLRTVDGKGDPEEIFSEILRALKVPESTA